MCLAPETDRASPPARGAARREKTGGVAGIAMKLDHLMCGHARVLVKIVHILRDHMADLAGVYQTRNGKMTFIRFGAYPAGRPGKGALPSLAPRVFVVHE